MLESGLATEFVTDFLPIVIDSTAVVIKYNVIKDLLIKKVHYCLSNSMQGSAKGLNFIDHWGHIGGFIKIAIDWILSLNDIMALNYNFKARYTTKLHYMDWVTRNLQVNCTFEVNWMVEARLKRKVYLQS